MPPKQAKARPHALARVWQRFWREDAMRELSQPLPAERLLLLRRARVAAEVAQRVEQSPEPFEYRVEAILCDLYRQSIHWSVHALASSAMGNATAHSVVTHQMLQQSIADEDLRRRVERAIDSGDFDRFGNLPAQECASLLAGMRKLALALIVELETDQRAAEALWTQRLLRVGLLLALLGVVAIFALQIRDSAEQKRDLAHGAPWRASSAYPGADGCRSPQQECSESPEFFFHTQEEQAPWVEFDLGSTQQVSGARVENRRDCCVDRAAPMVIEVSSDRHHWRQVARRDKEFSSWSATFAPTQARWVRFRLEQRNSLHLRQVRILR